MRALKFYNSSNITQKQRINIKHWRQLLLIWLSKRYNVEGLNWHYKIKLETGYHVPFQNAHFFKLQIRITVVFPLKILGAERDKGLVTPFIIHKKLAPWNRILLLICPGYAYVWICSPLLSLLSNRNKKYWLLHYQGSFKQWPAEWVVEHKIKSN